MIYVLEDGDRRRVKIGYAAVVDRRLRTHLCSNPSLRLLVVIPGTIAEERRIHALFAEDRDDREFFVLSGAVRRWIDEQIRQHGSAEPPEPTESCKKWLSRVTKKGRTEKARQAADQDLATWARLVEAAPRSARGGWTLWERCSGKTCLSSPGSLPVLRDEPAMSAVHYRGQTFSFHVWEEACKRYGKRPPQGAIRAGVRPRNHSVESGRKTRALLKARTETRQGQSAPPVTEQQPGLFDALGASR